MAGSCAGSVTASFFDPAASGLGASNGGFARSTAAMNVRLNFLNSGWNFDTVWRMPVVSGVPVLQFSLARDTVVTTSLFGGGAGTMGDPYRISTTAHLAHIPYAMQLDAGARTAHYRLEQDLDLLGLVPPVIGSSAFPFAGTFDGQGHALLNVAYESPTSDNWALFGYVDHGATLQNLRVTLASGAAVSTTAYDNIAGLVGITNGTVVITGCTVSGVGAVTGRNYVGGLVGRTSGGTGLSSCSSTVSVSGIDYVGGLIGRLGSGATLATSRATGAVVASNTSFYTGGLVGFAEGAISRCFASGAVSGSNSVGGLVGFLFGASSSVTNGYATGAVTANGSSNVGGAIGACIAGTAQYVYSTGPVLGTSTVQGGLSGQCGNFTQSFWDTQISGQGASASGSGKTTAEMTLVDINTDTLIDVYATDGWSGAIWDYSVGQYPTLR